MSAPPPQVTATAPSNSDPSEDDPARPLPTIFQRIEESPRHSTAILRPEGGTKTKKKRNHRGGKKKRARRPSFAASAEDGSGVPVDDNRTRMGESSSNAARASYYRLQGRANLSNTSLESDTLLDHRQQQSLRPRRQSVMGTSAFGVPIYDSPSSYRPQMRSPIPRSAENLTRRPMAATEDSDEELEPILDERTPLIPASSKSKTSGATFTYGDLSNSRSNLHVSSVRRRRRSSKSSSTSGRDIFDRPNSTFPQESQAYNVNHPPSMPGSPEFGATNRDMSFGDVMARDDLSAVGASPRDIDTFFLFDDAIGNETSPRRSPPREGGMVRRHTIALPAEGDVCFPIEGMSEMAGDGTPRREDDSDSRGHATRRRRHKWPDLAVLDDWSRFEKDSRSDERKAKKMVEPQLIGGRLRPIHKGWHRVDEDAPYRFTYFNEEFQSTIHSQTISELVQAGGSFRELFVPDPPELDDSSESESEEDEPRRANSQLRHVSSGGGLDGDSRAPTRSGSLLEHNHKRGGSITGTEKGSREASGEATPNRSPKSPGEKGPKPKRYGDRPTWWLDVLSPTDAEMKVISKTFGIHPLTAEDIMLQEAREKVELFRNYYFVNYRSFEQDMNNEDFLEPVNMYVVVFREGVISFHFSLTPHPANVRRRIRQLKDYLILSSDWISYAIIDDITDVFFPLIQNIEDEVDDIDDAILKLHSPSSSGKQNSNEKQSEFADRTSGESGGDMLRRVGVCRKKVMGLYRLLGNKADVIKGFAKRCNEHWEIAPRSEIGLYLGDIQDHIVTMTGNLSHYEKILARAHGNYLAQINIRMNERQEQTADVLGKLTVLGTIVLPMNVITGLWGMNVWVPGQQYEGDLTWFWCLTAGLLAFGLSCFFIAKMVYRIV
ncbi:hypothetical protein BJ875DRAFT_41849 [Amylocarpus encephaloides]|uniref:Uncharacterized protein n=1 Tax=Amylocarpus encephaloides TaxID=45428 RepID=A0A9P7YHA7_9HELO|nr:hypothetical protein BJ875DRAFT_41849 [Amylocarpus encephaloides]